MKLLFTLDYELFLGSRSGDVENCLIKPLNLYLDKVEPYGVRFTIFVDASYLHALKRNAAEHSQLGVDLEKVTAHLRNLQERGHDIQLHIHPQWYFSTFNGVEWMIDSSHYKLSDVERGEMKRLFGESKELLDGIVGKKTVAFRAGGFSAQPTELLVDLFTEYGLILDSSVCPGAFYDSECQKYDYRTSPEGVMYRFEDDICSENAEGRFMELPIAMHRVSPLFHWKLVGIRLWSRFAKSGRHKTFGNGSSVKTTSDSILGRLTRYYSTMATIDGYKINFLKDAIVSSAQAGHRTMCILGHPKLATSFSVERIDKICAFVRKQGHETITMSELIEKL